MATADEVAADLAAFKEQVPTLEEQLCSMTVPCWNNGVDKISTATAMTLLVAPIPLRVLSCGLSFEYWNLAASDSAYWAMTLNRGDAAAGYLDVARRTTQNTGGDAGGGIVARTPWTFDGANWANADLAAGDLLRLTVSPAGSPAAFDMPFTATIRYRPL